MGIPKYHKWLTERYPDAFGDASVETAEHVYVDVNALLHDSMRHATSENHFFSHLFAKFDTLFQLVAPTRSVFLGVDGPASAAKCLTQRQRRRAHANKDTKRSNKGRGKGKQGSQMSNNMLTPGVPFMTKLTSALEYYAVSRMAPNRPFARCKSVTVSGAQAIGEGEHKIVSQMLRNAGNAADESAAESHVIFSGDADVFLLSLVQGACRRVRVVSEQQAGADFTAGKRRGRPMLEIWNAEVLAQRLHQELAGGPSALRGSADEAAVRRDFALVSLLAGNDYLPELKCGLNPQKLWEQYLSLRRTKFPTGALIIAHPVDEGLPLSHLEGGWALDINDAGAAFRSEPYEHFFFDRPFMIDFMKTASSGVARGGDIHELAAEGVQRYLEGLLWILEMYHHGYCGDFFYSLEKSMHSSANASLIAQFLMKAEAQGAADLEPQRSEAPPMRPLTCALCVLPVEHAEQFLGPAVPALAPMFKADHPLLGGVNAIESCEELKECKAKVAAFEREMLSLRARGLDHSAAKAQLTTNQQRLEQLKRRGGDVDVVPLREVNLEVVERCRGRQVPWLSFTPDATFTRANTDEAVTLVAPAKGMPPARCVGLRRVRGEWPCGGVDWQGIAATELADEEAEEQAEAEEAIPENEPICVVVAGDAVEAYWPDDNTWLPATVDTIHPDGSLTVAWDQDGSLSEVPADYVRSLPSSDEEPPAKRTRF
mmetsp:Transcript_25236/g.58790  ORF Transcript_25236/g.58790 Transcript_25236/m.58790 type:complete len:712 (-) Transcript_25236:59-2194(-)